MTRDVWEIYHQNGDPYENFVGIVGPEQVSKRGHKHRLYVAQYVLQEDAKRIIKCVNMHDSLVAALALAGDVIESYYKTTGIDLGDASHMPFYKDTIATIDGVLEKVKGLDI